MISNIKESPLYPIANPDSMAFFGASNNPTSMGANLLMSMLAMGYEGKIFPVHPKETTVHGMTAYQSVLDIPEVPDVAVMVLHTTKVNAMLRECGQKGIKSAIIVSGGFKEVGGDGPALEKELISIAEEFGIRILGPNGLGVANPWHKVNTTFIPHVGEPGFIGLASQSGSFVTQMFDYLANLNLGFSTAFSVGNEANVDLVDAVEYLGACPHTKVIAMYIEGIRRGREFVEVAKSITPHKPIVAFYVGGSETGRKAGFSHTGSMAGPDELYNGIFRQAGVIRANNITELFDISWALGSLKPPKGNRVVVQTHSGGPGAAAADACGRAGLELPSLSEKTIERLAEFVPHTGSKANPVDITFSRNHDDNFEGIPATLIEDENTDVLLMYCMSPVEVMRRTMKAMGIPDDQVETEVEKMTTANAETVVKTASEHDKPVVGYTWRGLDDPLVRHLLRAGMPVFQDAERAAKAIAGMVKYNQFKHHHC